MLTAPQPTLNRRRTCPVCRRRCSLWWRLSRLRFARGELHATVRDTHKPPRRGGQYPETPMRKPVEGEG